MLCWVICTSSSSWLMITVHKHASLVKTTSVVQCGDVLEASISCSLIPSPSNLEVKILLSICVLFYIPPDE